jgi:hypothetical protein
MEAEFEFYFYEFYNVKPQTSVVNPLDPGVKWPAGSRSLRYSVIDRIRIRNSGYGSADPEPKELFTDPQHCPQAMLKLLDIFLIYCVNCRKSHIKNKS